MYLLKTDQFKSQINLNNKPFECKTTFLMSESMVYSNSFLKKLEYVASV